MLALPLRGRNVSPPGQASFDQSQCIKSGIRKRVRRRTENGALGLYHEPMRGSGVTAESLDHLDFVAYTLIIDDIVFPDGITMMGALGGSGIPLVDVQ
jgi:hypothetical protein